MKKSIKYPIKGKEVIISVEDKKIFESNTWYLMKARQLEEKFYVFTTINKRTFYLHRLIVKAKKGDVVDHKNRNTLDCRRNNLHITDQSFNRLNCHVRKNKKSSKYKGVFENKGRGKPFYSQIREKEKCYYLGSFDTELEASAAYNKKIKELYGITN